MMIHIECDISVEQHQNKQKQNQQKSLSFESLISKLRLKTNQGATSATSQAPTPIAVDSSYES